MFNIWGPQNIAPAARAKNGNEHIIPLGPTATALIQSLKNGSPFLFPMRTVQPRPMYNFRTWVDELREELQFEPDWQPMICAVRRPREWRACRSPRLRASSLIGFSITRIRVWAAFTIGTITKPRCATR